MVPITVLHSENLWTSLWKDICWEPSLLDVLYQLFQKCAAAFAAETDKYDEEHIPKTFCTLQFHGVEPLLPGMILEWIFIHASLGPYPLNCQDVPLLSIAFPDVMPSNPYAPHTHARTPLSEAFFGTANISARQFLRFCALCSPEARHDMRRASGLLRLGAIHRRYDKHLKGYWDKSDLRQALQDIAGMRHSWERSTPLMKEDLVAVGHSMQCVSQVGQNSSFLKNCQRLDFESLLCAVQEGKIRGTSRLLRMDWLRSSNYCREQRARRHVFSVNPNRNSIFSVKSSSAVPRRADGLGRAPHYRSSLPDEEYSPRAHCTVLSEYEPFKDNSPPRRHQPLKGGTTRPEPHRILLSDSVTHPSCVLVNTNKIEHQSQCRVSALPPLGLEPRFSSKTMACDENRKIDFFPDAMRDRDSILLSCSNNKSPQALPSKTHVSAKRISNCAPSDVRGPCDKPRRASATASSAAIVVARHSSAVQVQEKPSYKTEDPEVTVGATKQSVVDSATRNTTLYSPNNELKPVAIESAALNREHESSIPLNKLTVIDIQAEPLLEKVTNVSWWSMEMLWKAIDTAHKRWETRIVGHRKSQTARHLSLQNHTTRQSVRRRSVSLDMAPCRRGAFRDKLFLWMKSIFIEWGISPFITTDQTVLLFKLGTHPVKMDTEHSSSPYIHLGLMSTLSVSPTNSNLSKRILFDALHTSLAPEVALLCACDIASHYACKEIYERDLLKQMKYESGRWSSVRRCALFMMYHAVALAAADFMPKTFRIESNCNLAKGTQDGYYQGLYSPTVEELKWRHHFQGLGRHFQVVLRRAVRGLAVSKSQHGKCDVEWNSSDSASGVAALRKNSTSVFHESKRVERVSCNQGSVYPLEAQTLRPSLQTELWKEMEALETPASRAVVTFRDVAYIVFNCISYVANLSLSQMLYESQELHILKNLEV